MMGWLKDVRHAALIDEAEQVAVKHLSDALAPVRQIYAKVGLDIVEHALNLQELASAARVARAASENAQATYEVESAQSREVVEETKAWIDQLHLVARYARVSGHPLGANLEHLFAGLDAESWSKSMNSVIRGLLQLEGAPLALSRYGLPDDFVERGRQLAAALRDETRDAADASMLRRMHAARLDHLLEKIVAELERLSAARDLAVAISGEDLPGLELTVARGAAAPRSTPSAVRAPATEPTGL